MSVLCAPRPPNRIRASRDVFDLVQRILHMRFQSIAGEDVARDRQNTQQSQRRLVFVSLGIDFDLRQNGLRLSAVGGDEVLSGNVAVTAAEAVSV